MIQVNVRFSMIYASSMLILMSWTFGCAANIAGVSTTCSISPGARMGAFFLHDRFAVECDENAAILHDAADAEADCQVFADARRVERGGDGIARAAGDGDGGSHARRSPFRSVICGSAARRGRFLTDVVDQIVNVENVAAGEDAGTDVSEPFVDQRAVCHGADGCAEAARQLVLGDQAAGEQERIAVVMALGAGDGAAVGADLGDGHAGDALTALDVDDGVTQVERNAEIVEALDDVPLEAAGIGHQLRDGEDLCALERHAAGHDEADVAAAEDDDAAADHAALDVDKALRRPGGSRCLRGGSRGMFSAPRGRSRSPWRG